VHCHQPGVPWTASTVRRLTTAEARRERAILEAASYFLPGMTVPGDRPEP
jgi:hypothetical protein